MNILEELQNQLEDAKADHEAKLADAPDIYTARAAIYNFRAEHADARRQREIEFNNFLTEQAEQRRQREIELNAWLAEQSEVKRRHETEFAAQQTAAKALKDAKAEVIRATRALARQDITAAATARREAKVKEEADLEAFHARVAANHEALNRRMRREQPNALAEHEARLARDAQYSAEEHAAEEARLAANDKIV